MRGLERAQTRILTHNQVRFQRLFRAAIITSHLTEKKTEAILVREDDSKSEKMPVMEKLRMFVVQEPVVATSCLIAGIGLFLPAVVRPILDSYETTKQVPPTALSDVVAGVTGKKHS